MNSTPGPWEINNGAWSSSGGNEGGHITASNKVNGTFRRDKDGNVTLIPGQGLFICSYNTAGANCPGHEEGRANAHLIAAAPDMLEAIRAYIEARSGDADELLRAAWAKAHGK